MKPVLRAILLLAFAFGIGATGYWLGRKIAATDPQMAAAAKAAPFVAANTERKVLYYKDPMGKPDYSPVPKKDEMGTDYIPVYEGEEEGAQPRPAIATVAPTPAGKGKV